MKIKAKLLIGFSAILAIMLALTFIGYDRLNYMSSQLDSFQDRYSKGRSSSGLRGEVNDMARILTTSMLNADQLSVDSQKNEIEAKVKKAEGYLKAIEESTETAEEMQLLTRIKAAYTAYMTYQNKALDMLSAGYFQNANAYRNSEGQKIQNEVLDSLNALSDYNAFRMTEENNNAQAAYERSIQMVTLIMIVGLLLGLGVVLWVIPSITRGLNVVSMMIKSFGNGKMRAIRRIKVTSKDEIGEVARVFQNMAGDLEQKQEMEKAYAQAQSDQAWLNANIARVTELLRGVSSLEQVSQTFISEFTPVLGAEYGAIYLKDQNHPNLLSSSAYYAGEAGGKPKDSFEIGQGLVGQSALDKKPIKLANAPEDYVSVTSGFGGSHPDHILIYPVLFEDELMGVVEFASFTPLSNLQNELLHQLANNLGVILNNISRRLVVEELLRESQALTEELQCQSEELQTQQEELRRSNENLEEQTDALRRSEDLLQRQQEELEHYNTELVAKTRALEDQVQEVEEKKDEIEQARRQLEKQAMQLAVTSKYKSEFLANMSHELRTPLNSLLILSQLLTENKEGNLTEKQVEFAHTIYMSGADLLKMIDEILDLSKVDAGKMELNYEEIPLTDLKTFVKQNFAPQAAKKGLSLRLLFDEPLPDAIYTDSHRLKQILRNLLSNAFKFTSEGFVEFSVSAADKEQLPAFLPHEYNYIALSVKDSGIGIPADKTDIVFEAFQQVDGTTSRKYGGTGLGLSISRELARLMGGAIGLDSREGQGSIFTLYLPVKGQYSLLPGAVQAAAAQEAYAVPDYDSGRGEDYTQEASPAPLESVVVEDDREDLSSKDKVLLIIEDDEKFARILLDMARSRGFKGLVALQGDTGLNMATTYLPDAIILDIQLPVMDGWAILRELKGSSQTRHIPVHVISVNDEVKQGLMMGAMAYLRKPSTREALERAFSQIESYTASTLKHLLVVEDDDIQRRSIMELIGHDDVAITAVSTGHEALAELRKQKYDCMVLDLMLDDMTGFELLDQIRDDEELNDLPIIIYTGKDLDNKEETRLRKYAESIIIKDVRSPERLLDETTLFLHRVEANLPEDKRKILQKLHNKEELFDGKKILLVDDDIRNVFALSSVLEGYHMEVKFAENGREALDMLVEQEDFDLVLMDMMMPEMDGYEAMRRIRQMPQYQKLPIIALTAKAMKEDRAKCIEAGASDYMKKPISTEQLLSLMRVWLYS
ncbi:response regulator [Paenibacillus riograndensis]|uniref:Circadian input-output histidine kinase CikA n=1 Tax=Paenibacillus riograndensis SBR5 TaxID=1073571 RepID=A0A0E4CZ73_9BACL|nr:response regulator [Paenibacillus riograndensis]CQR58280.1 multi-sensor hybrid histidine kinase [Paenibacillus riograndensis SBR5]